jgi:hypothetical protein
MGAVDITARLRGWVIAAIGDAALGEEFWYDTTWHAQPQPGGAPNLVYDVVIAMRNPILGRGPLSMTMHVPIGVMQEAIVRQGVHQVMGQLRALYRQALDRPAAPAVTPPDGIAKP